MAALDYYRILGVKPDCTLEEVRRRYRVLARQHHPDLNPDDPEAAARFRLIAAAFEGIQAARAQARAKGRSLRGAANYRQPRFTGQEEVFEEFFGICQDGSPLSWSPGADFRYDLEISWWRPSKALRALSRWTSIRTVGRAAAPGWRRAPATGSVRSARAAAAASEGRGS
jgi:molecular chaperone DnaJ